MPHTVYSYNSYANRPISISRIKTLVSLNRQHFLYYQGKI